MQNVVIENKTMEKETAFREFITKYSFVIPDYYQRVDMQTKTTHLVKLHFCI